MLHNLKQVKLRKIHLKQINAPQQRSKTAIQNWIEKKIDLQVTEDLLKLCRPLSIRMTRIEKCSDVKSKFCVHIFMYAFYSKKTLKKQNINFSSVASAPTKLNVPNEKSSVNFENTARKSTLDKDISNTKSKLIWYFVYIFSIAFVRVKVIKTILIFELCAHWKCRERNQTPMTMRRRWKKPFEHWNCQR